MYVRTQSLFSYYYYIIDGAQPNDIINVTHVHYYKIHYYYYFITTYRLFAVQVVWQCRQCGGSVVV